VLDLSGLDGIRVADDRVATIRAGTRLAQVYAALHAYGRTLPAGCGPTVGITGLTLGGGIGLLGRKHGLTCDRLVGAQAVLPDGSVVDCDHDREPQATTPGWLRSRTPTTRTDSSIPPSHLIHSEGQP
jgi:FAD/FMN-containing dehydrogenase